MDVFCEYKRVVQETYLIKPIIVHMGVSHKSSSIEVREKLYLEERLLRRDMLRVSCIHDLSEIMVLQTCHRFEMCVVLKQEQQNLLLSTLALQHKVQEIFKDLHCLSVSDTEKVASCAYYHYGAEVCVYFARVVSSLEAQVVGETQITYQFKKAVGLAQGIKMIGPVLNRMIQVVQSVSKKIRSHTVISEKSVSMAQVTLHLAQSVFTDLSRCHIVILGAGEMGRLCARYAVSRAPGALTVVNRTYEKAHALIDDCDYKHGHACAWDRLHQVILDADVMIFCTSSQKYVLQKSDLDALMEQRKSQGKNSLFICDLALPRNVDPEISQISGVDLFNVDDVRCVLSEHRQRREKALTDAQPYLDDALLTFKVWLDHYPLAPMISQFHLSVEDLVSTEVDKTMKKSCFHKEHKEHLQKLSLAISQKMTALWAQHLKASSGAYSNITEKSSSISKDFMQRDTQRDTHHMRRLSSGGSLRSLRTVSSSASSD